MSYRTGIPYCTSTLNVVAGCGKRSPGCANCWALATAYRLQQAGHPDYAGTVERRPDGHLEWTGLIRPLPHRLDDLGRWRRPRTIFVSSMGDLFDPAVPMDFRLEVIGRCLLEGAHHRYLFLTKEPQEMLDTILLAYSGYELSASPAHILWGVTVEDAEHARKRLPILFRIPGRRWVSYEPALGPVDWARWLWDEDAVQNARLGRDGEDLAECEHCGGEGDVDYFDHPELWDEDCPSQVDDLHTCPSCGGSGIDHDWLRSVRYRHRRCDWLVMGCESGPLRRVPPDLWAWARDAARACAAARIPFYLKQLPSSPEGGPVVQHPRCLGKPFTETPWVEDGVQ